MKALSDRSTLNGLRLRLTVRMSWERVTPFSGMTFGSKFIPATYSITSAETQKQTILSPALAVPSSIQT